MSDVHKESDQNLSQEEIREYIRRFEDLESEFNNIDNSLRDKNDSLLKDSLGGAFNELLQSKERTLECLEHEDSRYRIAAIHVAIDHWQMARAIAPMCQKLAVSDPNVDVRAAAIGAVGESYARTKDPQIGRLLATIVRAESEESSLRLRAYTSLLRLDGELWKHIGDTLIPSLEDIKWDIVAQY